MSNIKFTKSKLKQITDESADFLMNASDEELGEFTESHGPENPVSPGYPEDGTCPYCGSNTWTIDCGFSKCMVCDNYD